MVTSVVDYGMRYFEYGGSTIIMLLQKNRARLDEELMGCMESGQEIPVRLGQRIGERIDA